MITKKKTLISWIIGVSISSISFAQEYQFQAPIDAVKTSGYHKVLLSPEVLGQLNSNKGDIRIYNEQGIETPYLLTQETGTSTTAVFKEYEIIDKHFVEDDISYLVFQNPDKKKVNNISIIVQNTDVRKQARLSGSDDNKTWYVIKNDFLLHSMHNNSETTELKILNFPLSNYAFFKLEIDDYWKLPINILKVGYYDYQKYLGQITTYNIPVIHQNDSAKRSFYKLDFPQKKYLEKLSFTMSGADYYRRHTSILEKRETINRKKEVSYHFTSIGTFELNSNSTNTITLGNKSTNELYIEINNLDNQPLNIENVTGSFLNKYLVVDLSPTQKYTIKYGDKNANSPSYDLLAFKDQIPTNLTVINHATPSSLVEIKPKKIHEKGYFDNKYLIWIIIGVVGVILAFISIKMVKEIGDKQD